MGLAKSREIVRLVLTALQTSSCSFLARAEITGLVSVLRMIYRNPTCFSWRVPQPSVRLTSTAAVPSCKTKDAIVRHCAVKIVCDQLGSNWTSRKSANACGVSLTKRIKNSFPARYRPWITRRKFPKNATTEPQMRRQTRTAGERPTPPAAAPPPETFLRTVCQAVPTTRSPAIRRRAVGRFPRSP